MTLASPSRPLRIAHVTGLISLKYGGFERFMAAFARACGERGHRLYCVWEAEPTVAALKADLAHAGAESLVMPAMGHNTRFLGQIARWLHRTGINVMYGHFNPAAILAMAAARLVRVPLPVGFFHSGVLAADRPTLPLRSRLVMRARLSLPARTYAVSAAVRDEIVGLGLGGRTPEVFYLGVPHPSSGVRGPRCAGNSALPMRMWSWPAWPSTSRLREWMCCCGPWVFWHGRPRE